MAAERFTRRSDVGARLIKELFTADTLAACSDEKARLDWLDEHIRPKIDLEELVHRNNITDASWLGLRQHLKYNLKQQVRDVSGEGPAPKLQPHVEKLGTVITAPAPKLHPYVEKLGALPAPAADNAEAVQTSKVEKTGYIAIPTRAPKATDISSSKKSEAVTPLTTEELKTRKRPYGSKGRTFMTYVPQPKATASTHVEKPILPSPKKSEVDTSRLKIQSPEIENSESELSDYIDYASDYDQLLNVSGADTPPRKVGASSNSTTACFNPNEKTKKARRPPLTDISTNEKKKPKSSSKKRLAEDADVSLRRSGRARRASTKAYIGKEYFDEQFADLDKLDPEVEY